MLEIAAGILLAIVVLLFVLANLGWIVVGLSAIFAAGIAIVGTVLIFSLPSDDRSTILIVLLGFAAVCAFAYWTHADKRFHLPEDERDQRRRVKQLKPGDRVSVTDRNTGIAYATVANVDSTGESFDVRWDRDGHTNTLMYFDIDLFDILK